MPDIEAFEKELDEALQSDHELQSPEEAVSEETPEEQPAEEPVEEPPAAEPEAKPEEPPEEVEPEAERHTIPDDPKFGEFAGKKLTALEMQEAGLLKKFNTLENNDVHHQKLYGEVKEKYDAMVEAENKRLREEAQPAQPQVPVKEQIQHNLNQMKTGYLPNLKQQAESGAFEEDFLVMFPDLAVQLEHRFVSGNTAIESLAQQVAKQAQFIDALLGVVEEASNSERFTGSIDSMVTENPDRYGVLREGNNTQNFVGWMNAEENPMRFNQMKAEDITSAVLAQAFLGFIDANQDLIAAPSPEPTRTPTATGGGTGTTATRARPTATAMDTFERAFEEASAVAD